KQIPASLLQVEHSGRDARITGSQDGCPTCALETLNVYPAGRTNGEGVRIPPRVAPLNAARTAQGAVPTFVFLLA
ncbi:MAG: hypothetical protein ABI651_22035, partial [Verrucomicrobiota bacterium]